MTKTYAQLASDWMALHTEEVRVREERIAVEQQMLLLFPGMPEEGQRSKRANGYLTTIKNGLNIRIKDREAFLTGIAEEILPPTFVKSDLYDTAVKQLRRKAQEQDEAALDLYGRVQGYFDIAPAKPAVQVLRYE